MFCSYGYKNPKELDVKCAIGKEVVHGKFVFQIPLSLQPDDVNI